MLSEGDAATQVQTDPTAAADVYMFASDQLGALMKAQGIGELGSDAEKQVKEQNGDLEVASVTGSDGKMYGVPYTDNTWFMYYDKSTFSEDDIKSLDTMVSKAAVAFPLNDSWYIGGFYDGLTLFGEDGTDPDAGMVFPKDAGDITKYLVDLAANPNFHNSADNMGVAQLPTFTVNGTPKQMKSFAATKAAAYNPNAKNPKAAAQFAAYLGSTESQKLHYTVRNIIPTDKTLTDLTADDPVAIGQTDTMANTAILQSGLAGMADWWDPAKAFGDAILNKEVTADNAQAKTDAWVEQVGSYAK